MFAMRRVRGRRDVRLTMRAPNGSERYFIPTNRTRLHSHTPRGNTANGRACGNNGINDSKKGGGGGGGGGDKTDRQRARGDKDGSCAVTDRPIVDLADHRWQ